MAIKQFPRKSSGLFNGLCKKTKNDRYSYTYKIKRVLQNMQDISYMFVE